jgi:hypothetical protein
MERLYKGCKIIKNHLHTSNQQCPLLKVEGKIMQFTLDIPEELATQLQLFKHQIPQILELGIREVNAASQPGFTGMAEVLEFLAQLPTSAEIIALRPSVELQEQISSLLEKNRTQGLTPAEEMIWEQYQYLEHLVRIAKARAFLKLKAGE